MPEFKKLNLLFVDDNPAERHMFREVVSQFQPDWSITFARDGAEALNCLISRNGSEASPPDLIVMDIHLPGKNGCEVLEEMRGHSFLADLPVVLLSATQPLRDPFPPSERVPERGLFLLKPPSLKSYKTFLEEIGRFFEHSRELPEKQAG